MRWTILTLMLCAACGRGVPEDARVVVAGDSVMAWNRIEGASVADVVSQRLDVPVGDVSLPYAQIMDGRGALNIPHQLSDVSAEWIVVNGGANDIGIACDGGLPVVTQLISEDGQSGAIPALVATLRARGSKVIWADYYTSPRFAGQPCAAFERLEDRVARMAEADPGVWMVDMDDVLDPDDATLFDTDRTHPSPEGSARIGVLIAGVLQSEGLSR
jgi:lysophospholipase L1-like esterase